MIHNSELTVESRIKSIASFLRLPQRLVKLARSKDAWLYLFMEEIYLKGDEEKLEECFGSTKKSAKEAFDRYQKRHFRDRSKEITTAYEDFSRRNPQYPHIVNGNNKENIRRIKNDGK